MNKTLRSIPVRRSSRPDRCSTAGNALRRLVVATLAATSAQAFAAAQYGNPKTLPVGTQPRAVAFADLSRGQDPQTAWQDARARINALEARMHQPLPASLGPLDWHDDDHGSVPASSSR